MRRNIGDISTSFEKFAAGFWNLQQNMEILNRLLYIRKTEIGLENS